MVKFDLHEFNVEKIKHESMAFPTAREGIVYLKYVLKEYRELDSEYALQIEDIEYYKGLTFEELINNQIEFLSENEDVFKDNYPTFNWNFDKIRNYSAKLPIEDQPFYLGFVQREYERQAQIHRTAEFDSEKQVWLYTRSDAQFISDLENEKQAAAKLAFPANKDDNPPVTIQTDQSKDDELLKDDIPNFDYDAYKIRRYCEEKLTQLESYLYLGFLIHQYNTYIFEHPEKRDFHLATKLKLAALFQEYKNHRIIFDQTISDTYFNLDSSKIIQYSRQLGNLHERIDYLESAIVEFENNPIIELEDFDKAEAKNFTYQTASLDSTTQFTSKHWVFSKPKFNIKKVQQELNLITKKLQTNNNENEGLNDQESITSSMSTVNDSKKQILSDLVNEIQTTANLAFPSKKDDDQQVTIQTEKSQDDELLKDDIPNFDYDVYKILRHADTNLSPHESYLYLGYIIYNYHLYSFEHLDRKDLTGAPLIMLRLRFEEYKKLKEPFDSTLKDTYFNLDSWKIIKHSKTIDNIKQRINYLQSAIEEFQGNPIIELEDFSTAETKKFVYQGSIVRNTLRFTSEYWVFAKPKFNINRVREELKLLQSKLPLVNQNGNITRDDHIEDSVPTKSHNSQKLRWQKDIDDLVFLFYLLIEKGFLPEHSPYATFIYDNFTWKKKPPDRKKETGRFAKTKENLSNFMTHPSEDFKAFVKVLYKEIMEHENY